MTTVHDITLSLLTGSSSGGGAGWIPGNGIPSIAVGEVGDYYLDNRTGLLYGPKRESGWGTPTYNLDSDLKGDVSGIGTRLINVESRVTNLNGSVTTVNNIVNTIKTNTDTLQTTVQNLSESVTVGDDMIRTMQDQVQAVYEETGTGFSSVMAWQFIGSTNAFTVSNGTMNNYAVSGSDYGALTVKSTGEDCFIESPGFSLNGKFSRVVRALVRTSGGPTSWLGKLQWENSMHDTSVDTGKTVASEGVANKWHMIEWNLIDNIDWVANTTKRLRLYLPKNLGDSVDIQWIAIGDKSYAASGAYLHTEAVTQATAMSALASRVTTIEANTGGNTANWGQQIEALTTKTDATVRDVTTLTAKVNNNTSSITQEASVRSTETTALAQTLDTLTAKVNGNVAAITQEATTRANADSASAAITTQLSAKVSNAESSITTIQQTMASNDAAASERMDYIDATIGTVSAEIGTKESASVTRDNALSTRIDTLRTTTDSMSAAIIQEATARANAISASASTLQSTIAQRFTDSKALIAEETSARTTAINSVASRTTTLETNVSGYSGRISTVETATANIQGKVNVTYGIVATVDASGGKSVGGLSIIGSSDGANPQIDFVVQANKFRVIPPAGSGTASSVIPFQVVTSGGVTGVFMSAAYIGSGVIGGDIQSSNFNYANGTGWQIQKSGIAYFNAIYISNNDVFRDYAVVDTNNMWSDAVSKTSVSKSLSSSGNSKTISLTMNLAGTKQILVNFSATFPSAGASLGQYTSRLTLTVQGSQVYQEYTANGQLTSFAWAGTASSSSVVITVTLDCFNASGAAVAYPSDQTPRGVCLAVTGLKR